MVVPLFQRPYVWSKERQWQPLWEDIARLADMLTKKNPAATHFLGAFVVQQMPFTLGIPGHASPRSLPVGRSSDNGLSSHGRGEA
ncbi:DUF262 domain-containing protein [Arthrobacter sp.]|uniref:DUF262 domain-containing protein n=1 Tax=Arthrobacter sp. TaxID=1667 RepID=UPI0028121341|nr:DUF262 domain-containing protein [Arthrobacter sp.]